MQLKGDHKHKSNPYNSTREYQSNKESTSKIISKPTHQKSSQPPKLTKANPHSTSKTKISQKLPKHNQNYNSINFPQNIQKNKNTYEPQHLKKETRKEEKLIRNSSQKLIKSKSAIRIGPKTQRNRQSQSPIMFKEQVKQEQKIKVSKSTLSKVNKDKKSVSKNQQQKQTLRRSSSMAMYQTKKQNTERIHANRISIKTEGSSKMNSVIKEEQRHKKSKKSAKTSIMKKEGQQKIKQKNLGAKKIQKTKLQNKIKKSILYSEVSFQQFCQQNPCESAMVLNERPYFHEEFGKVKTQGCQISCLQNRFSEKNSIELQHIAATKIQRVFRGYITRKYIEEAKLIITNVKIIQKWWRKILLRRKQKINKPSVQNSLITIKDFNQTIKSDRQRLFSQSKQNTLSNRKLNIKEIIKNILQQNQNQSEKSVIISEKKLRDHCLSPEEKIITKQVYVQSKIKAEINSEKVFNSPKLVTSPRSIQTPTSMVSIKDFFNNSSQRQKVKQMLQSPRMKSPQPQPPKSTPKSNKKQQNQKFQIYKEYTTYIQPFQTNFQAVEQIYFIFVDFFRSRPDELTKFSNRIKQLKYFRTQIILKNWKEFRLLSDSYYNEIQDSILPADYQYLQLFSRPTIFPSQLRQEILKFPSLQIELNNKNYNLEDETNKPIHLCYLNFVFDALEEAFYQSYKQCVLQWPTTLNLRLQCSQKKNFELAFSGALGFLCEWSEIMCGFLVNYPEDFVKQREQRMKLFEKQIQHWDLGKGNKLGIKIQISDKIEQELWLEILSQLIQKQM